MSCSWKEIENHWILLRDHSIFNLSAPCIVINKDGDLFENTLNDPKAFNVGRFDPKEENIGTGMVGAPACGDVMKLQIKCEPSGNTHVIKDVKFKTYGCGSAIASSSELVDMLIGKTLEEAKAIKNKEIVDALELPPIKIHCSVLAEDSIKQAIEDYESKQ